MIKTTATPTAYVYVGSFVMPKPAEHEGLHVFRVDSNTGALTMVASHVPGLNVGSFAVDAKRGVLYVADEVASTDEFRKQHGVPGGGGGRVYSFSINQATGDLRELGHWPSYGTQPAGLALDASGNFLVVSHFTSRTTTTKVTGDARSGYRIEPRYDDATTVLFPLDPAGCLGEPCDVHVHAAPGAAPPPCLHSVSLSRDGSFFIECDMEKDQLVTFAVDSASRSLRLQGIYDADLGSGPRYSVFHPTLPVFYVNYEYRPVIEAFAYREGGLFESVGTVGVLPDGLEGGPGILLSDLRVHPSGRYIYTLVRGHNVVSVLAVDGETGRLRRIQTAALEGLSPKGCAPSPDGRFLYVAVSVTNEVQVWSIGDDGLIAPTGQTVSVPRPSAITIINMTTMGVDLT
ncbi:Lactonase 7-bladed beta-propeller family protein [Pleurostoma richardsiae]|uniref:Lactonase 7-bladed beta-propeller family protein n=1 Tax=Pleurostoma richardsiae TaxID=41990 RepID=A0AA38VCR0_9PEZI|nr:Lactonase 7-bladed beta-propeller family protein [Pleurostoma richardsiae]